MKYLYLIFLLIIVSTIAYGQSVKGIVHDKQSNVAISYASIRLLSAQDSTYVTGGISSLEGEFLIPANKGRYFMEISFMGYEKYRKVISLTDSLPSLDLGLILLKTKSILLNQAIIEAPVPNIQVKGDTIEYNVSGYPIKEDALLLDLIERVPGIEISSDGKLMANGKPISKILVDGKEFFGNDIDLALKNLPVSMINKLQLFKEQSEMSQITGFKDGNSEQVLNLTVKDDLKQSVFGNVQIGYGSSDRYANKMNAHYMIDDNQMSLIGNMNNVNDNFEYSGGTGQYDGITDNKKIGININSENHEKLKIGGNVRYERNSNLFEMNSNTQTFINSGNRFNEQFSSSNGIKKDLGLGLKMKWTPDSLTTIYARINTSVGDSEDIRKGTSASYIENQKDTTTGWSDFLTKGDANALNTSVVMGRRLNSKGRAVTMTFNGSIRNSSSKGKNYSETNYQSNTSPKIIDQQLSINNYNDSWSLSASYVEPISTNNLIQISYNIRKDYTRNIRDTYRKDPEGEYSLIDTAYTRKNVLNYTTQRFSIGFQSTHEKYEYTLGFNIDPSQSSNRTNMKSILIEDQKQNVLNLSPNFKFTYNPKTSMTFDINYYGSTSQPTFNQLSSDTIIIDALSVSYGNPELKPSYENNLNMYFQTSNYAKGSFFMISMGANYIVNKIVDYTIIDKNGNTKSSYQNINGNWGLNGGILFNTPLRNNKFTVDNSSFAYLTRNIGYSNGVKNTTKNLALNETFSISYRDKWIDQRLQISLACNLTQTNLPTQEGLNTASYGLKSTTNVKLPFDINLTNDVGYTYNYGYSKEFQNAELLWNATISKQFLRRKQATIKFQCYDILNDRNNVVRTVTGNYVSDTRTNMIGRYFLFTLNYRFNFFQGNVSTDSDDTNYFEY